MSKRHLVVMELPEAKSIPILYHNHPRFKVPTSYLNIQIQGKIQAAISYSQSQYLSTVDLPNNGGVKGANSSSSQKSTYNVWPWRSNVPLYLWSTSANSTSCRLCRTVAFILKTLIYVDPGSSNACYPKGNCTSSQFTVLCSQQLLLWTPYL